MRLLAIARGHFVINVFFTYRWERRSIIFFKSTVYLIHACFASRRVSLFFNWYSMFVNLLLLNTFLNCCLALASTAFDCNCISFRFRSFNFLWLLVNWEVFLIIIRCFVSLSTRLIVWEIVVKHLQIYLQESWRDIFLKLFLVITLEGYRWTWLIQTIKDLSLIIKWSLF